MLTPSLALAEAKQAAMAIDANTGAVLYAQAADAPRYPASLTKMMTLYLVFERLDQGTLTLDTKIKVSQEATNVAPSKLDLEPGEEITVANAIRALVTKSANDIAVALAEHIAESEWKFAGLMTERARQIGMTSTTFKNASGLPVPGQVTTARDMLTLALRLHDDFPRYYTVFATKTFSYNGSTHRNHNSLLFNYRGTEGIKTGYTRASGFNLVSSVKRDGKHVVAAVFGGTTAASRNAQMRLLLDRALQKASDEKTRKPMLIARPKPAKRLDEKAVAKVEPKAPAKAATKVSEAEAKIARIEARLPPAAPPPPASQPNTPVAVVADATPPPAATSTPIHIAKVRRVMVAPRTQPTVAKPELAAAKPEPAVATVERPADTPRATFAVASASPGLDINALLQREATAAPAISTDETAATRPAPALIAASDGAPRPMGRPPGTFETQMAALASNMLPGQDPGPALRPSVANDSGALRSEPSRLGVTTPPPRTAASTRQPTQPAKTAAVAPAPTTGGGFLIQIGAFGTEAEAGRKLTALKQQAAGVLSGREGVTQAVQKGDRQLYRARFVGFDANRAAAACFEIRRLAHDCFVMKAE